MKCDKCGKEFKAGNRPDGLPNGLDFILQNGKRLTMCADCIMKADSEETRAWLDELLGGEQKMSDLISRQDAIQAIESIRYKVWEVDIPSPTVPEYVEHHKQMLELMQQCDTWIQHLMNLPSAQPETYQEKLNEIASALSDKFGYMNTCLNERDIVLGYLGVEQCCESHCNTDCTNTKCESHPLSSAQPEQECEKCVFSPFKQFRQKWIPVSERLPDDGKEVLMSLAWGVDIGEYRDGEWRSEWINHYDDDNVIAWMPLPEPYKGDEDD